MSERKGLDEFVAYLGANEGIAPVKQFPARVTFAADQPTFTYSLPLGEVVVYPRFLVFLTLTGDTPGMGYFVKSFFQDLASQVKTAYTLNKWVSNPVTFFTDVARHLASGYQNEDTLARALSCPNSIFIPFSEIRGATGCNSVRQANYIRVATTRGPLVICKDSAVGNPFTNFWSHVSGDWHSDVVTLLQQTGRANGGSGAA